MKRHNLKYLLIILIVSITMAGPAVVLAESPVELVEKGNTAYNAGNYDEALSTYDQAAKERPADAWIEFNKGAAFFRKGDLDKAKDAWEKAALGATEIPLEAESLYNLGTLEFSKVTQTQAADPEAALEAGNRSVRYYHEAKDLLDNSPKDRNNPLIQDASENIELVRRTMKSIQEILARQQEETRKREQAAEDLKNLIDQQSDLNARTQSQAETPQSPEAGTPDAKPPEADNPLDNPSEEGLTDMAGEQEQLREQTQKTAEKLTGPEQGPKPDSGQPDKSGQAAQAPDPAQAAKDHLNQAQARQAAAADNLNAGQVSGAAEDQKAALEEMKNALELLNDKDSQNKESQDKDGQSKDSQQSKDGQKQQGSPSDQAQPQADQAQPEQTQPRTARQSDVENKDDEPGPESGSPVIFMPDDAERILGEEKENKKIRRQVGSGGYQDVDKDW